MATANEVLAGYQKSILVPGATGGNDIEPSGTSKSFIDYQHPRYATEGPRWQYAIDHYTGSILNSDRIGTYLVRKALGESQNAYQERAALADYSNHLAAIIDSMAGMLASVEASALRVFNDTKVDGEGRKSETEILGKIDDPSTTIGRMWKNADGQGTTWLTLHQQLATKLLLCRCAWGMVDSLDGEPVLRYLWPTSVQNWVPGISGPREVLLIEEADVRSSLDDDPSAGFETRWVRYTLGGWQRYMRDPKTKRPVPLDGPNDSGTYTYLDRHGHPTLPIWPVELPLAREVGWLLAKRMNALFNAESARDHLLRAANFPKLQICGTDEHFEAQMDSLSKGTNALHQMPGDLGGPHSYIAPSEGPASIAGQVLTEKRADIYAQALRDYGDAAREVSTATEISARSHGGTGAFLMHLAAALDAAENGAYPRIVQTARPPRTTTKRLAVAGAADLEYDEVDRNQPDSDRWFTPQVTRKPDELPTDAAETLERASKRAFGEGEAVPVGKQGRIAIAKKVCAELGVEVNDRELEADVESAAVMRLVTTMAEAGLPMPAAMKADVVVRLLVGAGIIDPTKKVEGSDTLLITAIRAESEKLAKAEEDARQLEAQGFGGPSMGRQPAGDGEA